jgi:hypothetical protein
MCLSGGECTNIAGGVLDPIPIPKSVAFIVISFSIADSNKPVDNLPFCFFPLPGLQSLAYHNTNLTQLDDHRKKAKG